MVTPRMRKTVVVWLGAMLCCLLWGSAFPCIKIGYELGSIEPTDTASQILFAGMRFVFGGAILCVMGLAMGGTIHNISFAAVGMLIYLALVSAVAYSLWGILLKYNPISRVAVFGFMNQVFGITGIISLALVCVGIYVVNKVDDKS